ncbi:MAG: TatD family hydrolase [Treponema sp.]
MFSDSHCHLSHIAEKTLHFPLVLKLMENTGMPFIMDIGTKPGDFYHRLQTVQSVYTKKTSFSNCIHFSAGIWPDRASIENQEPALHALHSDITTILALGHRYTAVGECGIDRYWNGTHTKYGTQDTAAEELLFKKQLALAKKYGLAVIIHSRDAFEPTLHCIDEIGWHRGVIHCFSYGIEEAAEFIKRGWYISFPGTITYPEYNKTPEYLIQLLSSVPANRLLLETDAPYLSPVPVRQEINTPLGIAYTYEKVSAILHIPLEQLCSLVYENCCRLFAVPDTDSIPKNA